MYAFVRECVGAFGTECVSVCAVVVLVVAAVVVSAVVALVVIVVSLGMTLCFQIVRFSCLLKRRNRGTDGRTYGQTDERTDALIEMRGRI